MEKHDNEDLKQSKACRYNRNTVSREKVALLQEIVLSDILTTGEIESIMKESPNAIFDRNALILKFLQIAIEKLQAKGDTVLSKCLEWSKSQIQHGLDSKPDSATFKRFEKLKKEKPQWREKLNWIVEYSNLNTTQKDVYRLTKKNNTASGFRRQINDPLKLEIDNTNHTKHYEKEKQKLNYQCISLDEETSSLMPNAKLNYCTSVSPFLNFNDNLANISSPQFDIFKLEEAVGKENTLSTVSSYVFIALGLYSMISYERFERFLEIITKGYIRKNPYHTDLHAADVEQTCFIYYIFGNLHEVLHLKDLDIAAFLISAVIHDFKHPGVTNNFLINTRNEIALRYNDQSVLENFHVSESFKIIVSNPRANIFFQLTQDEFKLMRKRIVECVLATDMTLHNKELQYLKLKIQTFSISMGKNVNNIFENLDSMALFNAQQEFLNTLIHAADISNPTKPSQIYQQWAKLIVEEFFLQGDKEKQKGLPVSFLCDRATIKLPQSQIGFMEGIVLPLTQAVIDFFPGLKFLEENLAINREFYKKLRDEESENK